MSEKKTVFCVMPTRDRPAVQAWNAMGRAASAYGCPVTIQPGQPRDFNRNRCVALFLEQPAYDYILFVDDDTVVPVDAIPKLLALDKPVAIGVQPLYFSGIFVANVKLPDDPVNGPYPWPDWITWRRPSEPFRAGYCGLGCTLIRRDVLEKIGHPWFVEEYGNVWGEGNVTEDTYFCQKVAAAGYEIWCDPTVVCGHLKTVDLLDWLPRQFVNLKITRPTTTGE